MSILKGVKTLDVCKNLISYYNGTNAAMLQFTVPFSLRNGREEHKVLPKVMMRVKEFFKDIWEGGGRLHNLYKNWNSRTDIVSDVIV